MSRLQRGNLAKYISKGHLRISKGSLSNIKGLLDSAGLGHGGKTINIRLPYNIVPNYNMVKPYGGKTW